MRPFSSRERIAWTVVTAVLLAGLAFFALSPRLLAGSTEDETQAYLSTLGQVFREVRDTYVDADKAAPKALYEGALKGMFEALGDPYSMYLTAAEWTDMTDISTGSFGGVGLEITKVDKVGAQVVSALEGTPGYRAGVTAGDVIIKVNGNSMADLGLSAIRDTLRGPPKTDVTVTIKRGEAVQFDTTITRDIIQLRTVKYAMMPGGIGYLRLSEFTPQSAEQCRQAIRSFIAAGYTSMILDLRGNPGGLLNSAVDVANLFIDQGLIVQRKSQRVQSENMIYNARKNRLLVDPGIPVVVLVDRFSASAAEIVSGRAQGLPSRHAHRGEDVRERLRAERAGPGRRGLPPHHVALLHTVRRIDGRLHRQEGNRTGSDDHRDRRSPMRSRRPSTTS